MSLKLLFKTPSRKPTGKPPREFRMVEVIPHLYISNWPTMIPDHITHVLTMCHEPLPSKVIGRRKYRHLPLQDEDDITHHISDIIGFISAVLIKPLNPKDDVLVHCVSGKNRSSAAVITYLCWLQNVNAADGFMMLYLKKHDICPRRRFLEQIDGWFKRKEIYANGDVSREVCNRIEALRLRWMDKGRWVNPSDWVWMQRGGPWKAVNTVEYVSEELVDIGKFSQSGEF